MPKYIAKTNIVFEGKKLFAGQSVERDFIPAILASDFELIPESAPPVETIVIQHENKPALSRVGLFVTGRCNMDCAYCSQAEFRANHGDMEFETVVKIIDAVKASGRKMIFSITGGEPTLWPHLYEAFKLAKDAGCFPEAWLFSNGSDCSQVEKLLNDGLVTKYCTNAANCRPACNELKKKFPANVVISGGGHFPLIKTPIWNSIPAACNCPGVAVQGDRVWVCPNFFSIITRHRFDMEQYKSTWSRSVDEDWISFFAENETKKYASRICMFCEANKKCQVRIKQDEKIKRYSSGI